MVVAKLDARKASQKQEQRISKNMTKYIEPAYVQKASGAMFNRKSDIISKRFRIEAKTKATPSKSITLKREYFEKINMEAWETGKIPVLSFSFGDGHDYYILDEHDFMRIVGDWCGQTE
jgi:hypothetical protein